MAKRADGHLGFVSESSEEVREQDTGTERSESPRSPVPKLQKRVPKLRRESADSCCCSTMGGTALVRVKKASGLRQAPSFPPQRPEDAARVPISRLQRDTLFGLQSLCVDGLDACSAASSTHHRTFPSLPPTSDVPREVRTVRRAPFSPGVKLFVGEIFELWQDLVASQKQMWQKAEGMFPYARMWDAAPIDMLDILEDGLPPDERAANTPHVEINVTIKRVDHLPQKNPFVVLSFFEQVGTRNTFCHHCDGTNPILHSKRNK